MSQGNSIADVFPPPPLQALALPIGALLGLGAAVLAYIGVMPEAAVPWFAWPMAFANSMFVYLLIEIFFVQLPYVGWLKKQIPANPEPSRVAADGWFRRTLEQGLPLNEGRIYEAKYHDEKVDKQEQSLRRQFGARRGWLFLLPVVMVWTGLAINRWPESEPIVALYGTAPMLPLLISTAEAFICLAGAMVLVNRIDSLFAKWNSSARVYCGRLPHQDLGASGGGGHPGGGAPSSGSTSVGGTPSGNGSRTSTVGAIADPPGSAGDSEDTEGEFGLPDEDAEFDPLGGDNRRSPAQAASSPPPKSPGTPRRSEEPLRREAERPAESSPARSSQPKTPPPPPVEDEDEDFDVFR